MVPLPPRPDLRRATHRPVPDRDPAPRDEDPPERLAVAEPRGGVQRGSHEDVPGRVQGDEAVGEELVRGGAGRGQVEDGEGGARAEDPVEAVAEEEGRGEGGEEVEVGGHGWGEGVCRWDWGEGFFGLVRCMEGWVYVRARQRLYIPFVVFLLLLVVVEIRSCKLSYEESG